jgi:pyruvate kinase
MMDRVARQMEAWQFIEGGFRSLTDYETNSPSPLSLRVAVARSTTQLSRDLNIHALVVRSRGGVSATVVSATRPAAAILAMTPDERVCRRLNLLWGVVPSLIDEADFNYPQVIARKLACEQGLAQSGETILLLEGFGQNEPMIRVLPV